ncbi:hypothetical protein HY768_05940 [candidate division TA06 bacterium]|uniref:Uncharacterized protein n=1 Tax=candidate division TA06 bacterium TaxID=2250710 RepID=A0A933IB72_UNCT6|nr:hypothetical protein [candidate division TA06 bacterium]
MFLTIWIVFRHHQDINLTPKKEAYKNIELTKAQFIAQGARYRGSYLEEQYGYTNGVAASDGADLSAILPPGMLNGTKTVAERVSASMKDKALLAAESKDATRVQNGALQQAKVWRRKVAMRAMSARRLGANLPDGLCRITQVKLVPAMAQQMETMTKLLEANAKSLAGTDIAKLLAEGKTLLGTLKTADADQEVKRLKSLPDAVCEFYAAKGTRMPA